MRIGGTWDRVLIHTQGPGLNAQQDSTGGCKEKPATKITTSLQRPHILYPKHTIYSTTHKNK